MEYDEDGRCWVLIDPNALIHWRTLKVEPWKPGVVRLHLITERGRQTEFRLVYARGGVCGECGAYREGA